MEVPADSVATGILCQGLVGDGSSRVEPVVAPCVDEAPQEHGAAGDVDAAGHKRGAKKRSKRLLTILEAGSVKNWGPPSLESQDECVERSSHGLTVRLNDSLECQESVSLAEMGRDRRRRKKKKGEAIRKEIRPTKERPQGTEGTKDEEFAAPDKQSELFSPKELVPTSPFDSGREDALSMEVSTKKRKKRRGGAAEIGFTEHRNLLTVEEEIPDTATEKREKRKKKRKNLQDCGSGFISAGRTDAVPSTQVGCLLTTAKSSVEQVSAREGVEGLVTEVAEGCGHFPNEKTNKKKKRRQREDTIIDTENLMLDVADVGPEVSNGTSRRNKNTANDAAFTEGDKKKKRRKGAQRKLDKGSSEEADKLEEPTEHGLSSVIAFPVKKSRKLESGKRIGQQSEDVELQESRKSDSAGRIVVETDVTGNDEIPLKQGMKHRKKESTDVAGSDLDIVKVSKDDKTGEEEEGMKSLRDMHTAGSRSKHARNSPSVRKKKRKQKSDRILEEVVPTGTEADIENNETSLDSIWKKYAAQTPEKPRRSRVGSGKKSKVARKLISLEGHGAAVSPKRKKKKEDEKVIEAADCDRFHIPVPVSVIENAIFHQGIA
eukprot:TRINITY_DN17656_c0_g1_i1.p1 TRINITY_DN17656_c0_g1~~TRINITY_DN17656_c0_g1_i1.p1  ORF type:complete len:641 (-),score=153.24 TRINITY_DN17656_c0_g1_i1:273-2081(-)